MTSHDLGVNADLIMAVNVELVVQELCSVMLGSNGLWSALQFQVLKPVD